MSVFKCLEELKQVDNPALQNWSENGYFSTSEPISVALVVTDCLQAVSIQGSMMLKNCHAFSSAQHWTLIQQGYRRSEQSLTLC